MPDEQLKPNAAIFLTIIVYSDGEELHHNTYQSNVSWADETEFEDVRAGVGRTQIKNFLDENDMGVTVDDIRYACTFIIAKPIISGYLEHLAGIN